MKSEDYVVAWSYEDERRVRFNYSSVRREASKAYDVKEVADLMEKRTSDILTMIDRNLVDRPSGRLYSIANKRPGQFMWSESDIFDLRDAMFELAAKNKYGEPHRGFKLISKSELLGKMHEDMSYYVRNEDGEFVRVWRSI